MKNLKKLDIRGRKKKEARKKKNNFLIGLLMRNFLKVILKMTFLFKEKKIGKEND